MLFNSLTYAVFLPVVFFIYWMISHKYRWVLLLVSSYYFYMSWNPKYVVLILFTTFISYICGILLKKVKKDWERKLCLTVTLAACLGVLFFFKYFNFVSKSICSFVGLFTIAPHPVLLKFMLPVGISFYTFQTLSYVIDVYRGTIEPEYHLGIYATFVSFFPQLVAGPIERAGNLLPQIRSEKHFDYDNAMYGARQILWGLFKKIAVADVISVYVDAVYKNPSISSSTDCLIAIFFFTIQIYCDFSGYSDIAIGSAKLFGIQLMTNFKSPYYSLSVREFWSRWHISLSTWFKDYLYIPLGGNRCSKWKNYINILFTFLVSGLWHGANWTFVVWGGIHGLAQILEKQFHTDRFRRNRAGKIISWIVVFLFCSFAWVFFRADSLKDATVIFFHTFSGLPEAVVNWNSGIGLDMMKCLKALVAIAVVGVFDFVLLKQDLFTERLSLIKKNKVIRIIAEYALVALIIYSLENGADMNQFVYFQF